MNFQKTVATIYQKKGFQSALGLTLLNTAIAIGISLFLKPGAGFMVVWVFSMCIGTSISLVSSFSVRLIWKNAKPPRIPFLLVCIGAAPVGYYLGGSVAMFIFGYEIPSFMSLMNSGNRILIIMSAFVSLIGGISFFNNSKIAEMQAAQDREKANAAAIERQAMQAQLQLLQAQIEPHMLFNTLANLQGLIAIDTERAQHMLDQLIRYLRASLLASRIEKTTLKNEFELMRAYLELIAIRMGKRLQFHCDLPKDLESQEIAPMLIQPLVENAIKHGIEPKMEGGSILVTAQLTAEQLHIQVVDTGLGLPPDYSEMVDDKKTQHQHIGNANVRERIFALYGSQASLRLSNQQPSGVIADLILPLTKNLKNP